MKPDWNDAPEWAQWLAMDENGFWHWYEIEPEIDDGADAWNTTGEYMHAGQNFCDWRDTLTARPVQP